VILKIRDEQSQRMQEYNEKRVWVEMFDPSSSQKLRHRLKKSLRDNAEETVRICQNNLRLEPEFNASRRALLRAGRLPKDLTVAVIMTSGYPYLDTYAYLNMDSKAERFVLLGYSSGLWDHSKFFSDGTPMTGRIFATREDLDLLKRNSASPLLFSDTRIDTGLTVATLGLSLKAHLGYSGPMYQVEKFEVPVEWNGAVHSDFKPEAYQMPTVVPIVTDSDARPLLCVQRSRAVRH
jgi:hypothetical protein